MRSQFGGQFACQFRFSEALGGLGKARIGLAAEVDWEVYPDRLLRGAENALVFLDPLPDGHVLDG